MYKYNTPIYWHNNREKLKAFLWSWVLSRLIHGSSITMLKPKLINGGSTPHRQSLSTLSRSKQFLACSCNCCSYANECTNCHLAPILAKPDLVPDVTYVSKDSFPWPCPFVFALTTVFTIYLFLFISATTIAYCNFYNLQVT